FFEPPRERFDAAPARPATATLFDYLADDAVPVIAAGALEAAERFHGQVRERHEQRRHDVERPLLPPDELWLGPVALRERLTRGERIEIAASDHARHGEAIALGDQPAPELPLTVRNEEPAAALKSFLASYPGAVLVAADSPGRREALLEMLQPAGLHPAVLPDFPAFLELVQTPGAPAGVEPRHH